MPRAPSQPNSAATMPVNTSENSPIPPYATQYNGPAQPPGPRLRRIPKLTNTETKCAANAPMMTHRQPELAANGVVSRQPTQL